MLNHSAYGWALRRRRTFLTPAELEWQELSVHDTPARLHGLWAHLSPHNNHHDGELPQQRQEKRQPAFLYLPNVLFC